MPGSAPPLLPSSHCLNSLSPATIPPWKYSLPLPPLPCPRESGDPSPSVIPSPVSSRRRGPITFRYSPPPCPREGGDPSHSVIPPPVSSRRRGPIPLRHSASRVLAEAGTHPTPSFPPTAPCSPNHHSFPLLLQKNKYEPPFSQSQAQNHQKLPLFDY